MADLPFMMMDWSRFFSDAKVEAMPVEVRGVYALLLGKMWMNGGWLSADARIISRLLGVDIRRWQHTYKPLIEPLLRLDIDPHVGSIYTQKHLTEVRRSALDLMAIRAASTARARAAKAAKHGRKPSVAERKTAPASASVAAPVTASAAGMKEQSQKEEALPIKKAESLFPPEFQGELASSGAVAPLVAGSLPAPSAALLRSRIVANGSAEQDDHRGGAPVDPEPVPEPEGAQRADQAAAGIFAALGSAAARRKRQGDDEP